MNRVARAFWSFSSEVDLRADVGGLGARGRVGAEHLHQAGPLGRVALARGRGGLLGRDRHDVLGRPDGLADAGDPRRERDDVVAPDARVLVAGEAAREPDVLLGARAA